MRVLVIGGTGFIGPFVVRELLRLGHEVAIFHRGRTSAADTGPRIETIIGDRKRLADSAARIRAFRPEVVVDVILSSGAQARELLDLLRGISRRAVALSSLDVYR